MRLIALEVSHKTAPLELLERVNFSPERLREGLKVLHVQASLNEAAILSTCHRTEIYTVSFEEDPQERMAHFLEEFHGLGKDQLKPHVRSYQGRAVVEHLCCVAAGLESMVLGESQVLGQVREAYGEALGCATIGKVLSRLFRVALRVGKRARTETGISRTPVSMATMAIALAEQRLGDLQHKRALILGSGEMSQLAARLLRKCGVGELLVVSRTYERAQRLAQSSQGRAIPWERLPEALRRVDLVISSTAAPHPVLRADTIRKAMRGRIRPLMLLDIAMPRDIEPKASKIPNVHLYNLDDLQAVVERNLQERRREIPVVQAIIDEECEKFMSWLEMLKVVPTLKALRERAERLRVQELERALKRLGPLSERERAIIEQLSCRLITKLLHKPTVRLKRSKNQQNGSLEEAVRELFGLEEEL